MNDLAVSVSGWKAGAVAAWLLVVFVAGNAFLFGVLWDAAGLLWRRWQGRGGDGWVVVEWLGPMESLVGKLAREYPGATSINVEALSPSIYRFKAVKEIKLESN